MIYLTLLVYVNPGKEVIFHKFENYAIPGIKKHNGELLTRIRPTPGSYIDGSLETPYEIHIVSFPSEEDLMNFSKDPDRKNFLHLKEESIREQILIKGEKIG